MKIFEHPNTDDNWKCPICNTNEDKPIVLIGIDGTENGGNIQAQQYHLDCLELRVNKEYHLIYQRYEES